MPKRKRERISLALITFLLLASIAIYSNTAKASDEKPLVYFDPSVIDLPVSTNFVLKLKIANVTDLYGFDFQLKWDPTVISHVSHVVKVPVEDYPDGVLHADTMKLKNVVNEADSIPSAEPGTLAWIGYSSIGEAPSFNGSGIAVEFTFQVKAIGRCWIEFVTHDISSPAPSPIAHDIQNALFDNRPASTPVDIYVDPSTVFNSSLTPCHNFSVDISVEDVTGLYSFELWVGYNTTILNVTEVTVNPSFPSEQTTVELLEEDGQVGINASLTSSPGISGDPILATIKFHVEEIGETVLDLHNVTLINEYEEVIPYNEPGDGYFNNMLITKMFINPPELIAPEMKPGDTFTIDVQIENAIGMYDYEFQLSYDTDILTCLGAIVVPPNNDTHFTVEMQMNDTEGVIWVKVQYYSPAEPISIYSAKTVTEITFMMQDYGQTILDLHDTRISDPSGGSMSHEVGDGFFASLLRDVAIVFVNVTSSNKVYAGRIVTIEVIAMNRGNMTAETFNVTAYYDSNPIGTQLVTIDPWTNLTLTFYWNTTGLTPCSNFTIWAEASEVPYEISVANNVFYNGWVKIKILGDVNGDGAVDLYDAVILLAAYGSREGDPDWNPECDLCIEWGIIDLYDAVMLNYRYGQHC
jgi:hypothetical protein